MTTLLICVCGGIGASLRYLIDTVIKVRWRGPLPFSTLVINLSAGFFAGLVAALFSQSLMGPQIHLLLATGLLGGFSTFSTAINEVVVMLRARTRPMAICYFLACLILPIATGVLGYFLGGLF